MTIFGKCGGGGRRQAQRSPADLPALVTTVARAQPVLLMNVSAAGARLRGTDLPDLGGDLMLKIDKTEAFGVVQWKRQDLCGVAFDQPLREPQVEQPRSEASRARLTKLSPEERLAMQDWSSGMAR
ncbi:PilZ domain-containing protein [uncultured Sphingomonas sp.]|uniref:PilZ domain-containing protein n=1 Tax=uncultured Sphingomonas sp. TaxID=158754 RepID=UPI0025F36679|nr:PilZ domain-containing protein [uncultured Sphingomonas sp.]